VNGCGSFLLRPSGYGGQRAWLSGGGGGAATRAPGMGDDS
jgi:hypothetical protein